MAGDVVLGVTEQTAAAREWATRRAESRGATLREVVIGPARDDVDAVAAALGDAEILVLSGEDDRHHRALIAAAARPVAIVPEPASLPASILRPASGAGVLVGVDETEVSARALQFAASEARDRGVTLTALAAWEPVPFGAEPGVGLSTAPLPVDLGDATAAMLERMLEPVRETHPDLEIRSRVEVGSAALMIAEASADAALTVVGSHGRTGLARLLLGSVSEHVVEHVHTPTVVVP